MLSSWPYKRSAMERLLLQGFSAAELRRMCRDDDQLMEVCQDFGEHASNREMVDTLLEFAERKSLYMPLLNAVKTCNPGKYREFEAELFEAQPTGVNARESLSTTLMLPQKATVEEPAKMFTYDTAAIRALITDAYDQEGLEALCFDQFPNLASQITASMSMPDRVQRLLAYVVREERVEDLLAIIQRGKPAKYAKFEARLRKPA